MSLQYEYYDSLAHHGVKGMKWGVRRDRLNEKIKVGEARRATLAEKKGVMSKAYRKASRDLYELKARRDIASAKADGDKKRIDGAKLDYVYAKDIKKHGTESGISYVRSVKKAVYGEHLTNKQIDAIGELDAKEFFGKYKTKQGMKAAANVLGAVGSMAAATYILTRG